MTAWPECWTRQIRLLRPGSPLLQIFLSPPERVEAEAIFQRLTDVHIVSWGGYPQAERQRIAIARSEIPLDNSQIPLALVDIAGNFMFDPATHRDFLGALLGTGIVREKVGDILVLGERGAQAIVVPELLEFLTMDLNQVRSVPVKTQLFGMGPAEGASPQEKGNDDGGSLPAVGCGCFCGIWDVSQQNGRSD